MTTAGSAERPSVARNKVWRILMVCTGNICRSPTAEAVMRELAAAAGWGGRLEVDSAGTTGWHVGEAPDVRSQRHAARRGYDLSGLRARQLAPADFERFDLLLAMDAGHLQAMQRLCPPVRANRLHLLLEDRAGSQDVPDPYYANEAAFEAVLDLVEQGCAAWLRRLARPSLPIDD